MMSRSDWSSQPPRAREPKRMAQSTGATSATRSRQRATALRVGPGVGDRGHLVADAVSPHRWHGAVTVQVGISGAL